MRYKLGGKSIGQSTVKIITEFVHSSHLFLSIKITADNIYFVSKWNYILYPLYALQNHNYFVRVKCLPGMIRLNILRIPQKGKRKKRWPLWV